MKPLIQSIIEINLSIWGKVLLSLVFGLFVFLAPSAQARITDLTLVRCSDIFPQGIQKASSKDQRHFTLFVFWLAGFEAGYQGRSLVDITRVEELSDVMLQECAKDPEQYCFDFLSISSVP